jgi:hypothetical protein
MLLEAEREADREETEVIEGVSQASPVNPSRHTQLPLLVLPLVQEPLPLHTAPFLPTGQFFSQR